MTLLEVEGQPFIEDPTPDQIKEMLESIGGASVTFAILGKKGEDQYYVQVSGAPDAGFGIEYREGSQMAHYASVETALPLERVIEVFRKYAGGDAWFSQGLEWEQVTYDNKKAGCLGMMVLVLTAGLLV